MTMNIIIDEITGAYSTINPYYIHGDKLEPNCNDCMALYNWTEKKNNKQKIFR